MPVLLSTKYYLINGNLNFHTKNFMFETIYLKNKLFQTNFL